MTDFTNSITIALNKLSVGIAWCLAWGTQRQPQFELTTLHQMRKALNKRQQVPEAVRELVEQVQRLQDIREDYCPPKPAQLQADYPDLWQQNTQVGLVYGGATKIKSYVFEAAKLQDVRGASALLDRINLIDLPAFFGENPESERYAQQCQKAREWLNSCSSDNSPISDALIPELIIYSSGGNILAFCPAAFVNDLANAIEKRYTEETLTANSCAVGDTFRLLEIRFGLLQNPIEQTPWLDWYQKSYKEPIVEAYFGHQEQEQDLSKAFFERKSFNELAGKLAAQFNQRRNGNDLPNTNRPSRRYPPMFETHPYLVRDESDRRSAVCCDTKLPGDPKFSEPLARKRIVGQMAKHDDPRGRQWYEKTGFDWQPGEVESWISRFEPFLRRNSERRRKYYAGFANSEVREARSLTEIGNVSNGFVAYIYADGNNMGGYIQKIKTSQEYQQFSKDIYTAIEDAVYEALSQHLNPHKLDGLTGEEHENRNGLVVHPFEILAIGGDDVMLIVPADKVLAIAKTIGEEFERLLECKERYQIEPGQRAKASTNCHRYLRPAATTFNSQLSMSTGVLITAYSTPIYYAQDLTEQLLKSAKKQAKELKKQYKYYGGTVDFLTMKSVTMISSNIGDFRKQGLTKSTEQQKLKLYAAPYTLHELGGLIQTVEALKASEFPRSQLYQIRSLLEQGKNTAILNYRYFRVRLKPEQQRLLKQQFEDSWCAAKTNNGNLSPWMFDPKNETYETIWRELVDLYPFIDIPAVPRQITKEART